MKLNPFRSSPKKTAVPATTVAFGERLLAEHALLPLRAMQIVLYCCLVFFLTLLTRAYMTGNVSAYWLITPAVGTAVALFQVTRMVGHRKQTLSEFFRQECAKEALNSPQ